MALCKYGYHARHQRPSQVSPWLPVCSLKENLLVNRGRQGFPFAEQTVDLSGNMRIDADLLCSCPRVPVLISHFTLLQFSMSNSSQTLEVSPYNFPGSQEYKISFVNYAPVGQFSGDANISSVCSDSN